MQSIKSATHKEEQMQVRELQSNESISNVIASPEAIVIASPDDLGAWMEWSDEDACDLVIIFVPGVRYYYFCDLLSGGYRFATDAEIDQYLASVQREMIDG